MVLPSLIISTDIPPGERGILSLFTPGVTLNEPVELPHRNITVAAEETKATAHMVS